MPLQQKKFVTYANTVVDYRPQKDAPYHIRITAEGNLITHHGDVSVQTVDQDTTKLHWNSVISTKRGKIYVP
jgi:hypothetical protein